LNTSDYTTIGDLVLNQCDELDGLKDGIITDPRKCQPDLTSLLCSQPSANTTSCLNEKQVETMHAIWNNYTWTNGTFLFPGFEPGAEGLPNFSVTGLPYGPGALHHFNVLIRSTNQPLHLQRTGLL
jgi:hypothetical protein